MRIVGGKFKGRKLLEFSGQSVRPTPDMVRESIFNILQFRIHGAYFLDLFSGTGAMGIEAISRGAKEVVFNDKDRESVKLIKKNLEKLGEVDGVKVLNCDALTLLKSTDKKFDIIYIDPPYKTELGVSCLPLVNRVLSDGGVVIFEDEKEFSGEIDGLILKDKRKYGRVRLAFFEKGE